MDGKVGTLVGLAIVIVIAILLANWIGDAMARKAV